MDLVQGSQVLINLLITFCSFCSLAAHTSTERLPKVSAGMFTGAVVAVVTSVVQINSQRLFWTHLTYVFVPGTGT